MAGTRWLSRCSSHFTPTARRARSLRSLPLTAFGARLRLTGVLASQAKRGPEGPEGDLKMSVVHCKCESYDVYIGRGRCPQTGEVGRWGNPFRIGSDGDRDEVIGKYRLWL